jgi:hypothetical protein
VDRVQIEDVESPHHGAVNEHRTDPLERAQGPKQGNDPAGAVRPVDPDRSHADGLKMLGEGDDHGGDRGEPVSPSERAVVDGRDPRVGLSQGPTQR